LTFTPRDPSTALCSDCFRQRDERRSGSTQSRPQKPTGKFGGGLPDDYLRFGYFDSVGNPRKEMIIDEARAAAEALAGADLAAVKLQGLYNRARMLKDKLARTGDFPALQGEIRMLLIDAIDATGRKVTPRVFLTFVERNVELAVLDPKSFTEGFVEHLRCVRAWFLLARSSSNYGRR
jgi:hypothetical protein